MSHEDKFSQQITDFQRYGTYQYKYDEVGNVVLNAKSDDFSKVYLAFPLGNFSYKNAKIEEFYDPEFQEFIPATQQEQAKVEEELQQTQAALNEEKAKNEELTTQLNSLIEASESNDSAAKDQATKQVILDLRKELGQGRVDSDFSEDFPYTPIIKETREES